VPTTRRVKPGFQGGMPLPEDSIVRLRWCVGKLTHTSHQGRVASARRTKAALLGGWTLPVLVLVGNVDPDGLDVQRAARRGLTAPVAARNATGSGRKRH